MADNFNIHEWKYLSLVKEEMEDDKHIQLLNKLTEFIMKEYGVKNRTLLYQQLGAIIGDVLQGVDEVKKKVEEKLDPEVEVIELTNDDIREIVDRVESNVPYDENEDAFYDEDGIVFSEIAKYAMDEIPEDKAFYISLQNIIEAFDEILDERLVITGTDLEYLNTQHEFLGDFGYSYGEKESDIEEGRVKKAKSARKRKKKDRCHLKADEVYGPETSAYKSGAIVKCRKGKQWKRK